MGLIVKATTNRLIQPQQVPIGQWVTESLTTYPFLKREEVSGFAGMRALLSVDPGSAVSTLTEGKHHPIEFANASTRSLLRCEADAGSGTQLTCGSPSPNCSLPTDWTIDYSIHEDGTASVNVRDYRSQEGQLVNGPTLTSTREAVVATLDEGVNLHVADGPPATDRLVELRDAPAGAKSPFDNDYLDVLDDRYRRPLVLPAGAGPTVRAAMNTIYPPPQQGPDSTAVVNLAAARMFAAGTVSLRRGTRDEIAIDLPANLPPVERQRSYRAALLWLGHLAAALADQDPTTATAIRVHVARIGSGTQRPDRHKTGWTISWGAGRAAEVVPVAAGRWYPIGIRVLSTTPTNFFSQMVTAQQWVGVRKRTYARGLTQKSQEGNRIFTARRPGILVDGADKQLPYVRYSSQSLTQDEVTSSTRANYGWFWEVKARWVPPADGVEEGGLLLVTGWSHADGIVGYGVELLAMLRTFADVVTQTDPLARIQTLYLAS